MKNLIFFILAALLITGLVRAQTELPALPPPPPDQPPVTMPAESLPPMPDEGLPPPLAGDEGAPIMQIDPDYNYDPTGRRDPFKPYGTSQNVQMTTTPTNETTEKAPAPTDPLQMYDISQFRLVGVIWQVKKPKAVVRDPIGKMHLIYRDTKIGRNNGFVASIREGEVLVVEPTIGENGMPSAITRSMTLKK
jgi:type IV pilus assembly protein PilP